MAELLAKMMVSLVMSLDVHRSDDHQYGQSALQWPCREHLKQADKAVHN